MVDYSQRYDAVALGENTCQRREHHSDRHPGSPDSWWRLLRSQAGRLDQISFEDPKRIPVQEKYPADVVGLLPALSKLKPASRQTLKTILAKPQAAADLLASIDNLTQVEPVESQPADSGMEDEQSD